MFWVNAPSLQNKAHGCCTPLTILPLIIHGILIYTTTDTSVDEVVCADFGADEVSTVNDGSQLASIFLTCPCHKI